MSVQAASVDPAEIERFSALSAEWWNPVGSFRPLHKFNPVRLGFVRDAVAGHFGLDPLGDSPLSGLRLLDIGCGGGLVSEPMARLGASVVGVDASEKNIGVARHHAAESGLEIDYRCTAAEELVAAGERFDVILALEVVEHVADPAGFCRALGQMLKPPAAGYPGGLLVAATLNRTPKAYALAIVGAEYILRWLPAGTHDWKKFLKPHELAKLLRDASLSVTQVAGASYAPLSERWTISRDTDVNYLMVAEKR
ncbi:bifunctional 2-polyprenyl-6-hydroxyphenol methylase/3-demethylubiquinol 3-O-methyltransferase UbiG [Ferrovibrio sp.]|uniref:bifunctional 2-polyprenyl-6-hydroxyphenol methylase/3-demethylubiquinol 3-O-methyltransferase UbiG n=1 Tax=Ferrovibrio sp. TaxID=1917215 RepID=UPI003D1448B5